MSALAVSAGRRIRRARHLPSRSHAVPLLQAFALTVMVIPSDTVIRAIGAEGYPAALVGMFAFVAFVAATLLGLHNPLRYRHPVRAVVCLVWLSVLVSYVLMNRATLTITETAGADRMVMRLMVVTGVALVAAECLSSLHDVKRVLRALCWGGAFCGVVAALQFWVGLDLSPYLRLLPGFAQNFDNPAIVARAGLNRAAGTSINAIELGVVAGMLLPLAIYLAIYDTGRSARSRWAPVALIGLAIPTSVSRSAVISVALAVAMLVVLMPSRQRLIAVCALPLPVVGIFMSAPGLIGTLTAFFGAGSSDDSVKARVDDYPLVERLVSGAPWFGRGGGTWIPENPLDIFDNEYIKTVVELGVLGVIALVAYFLVPLFAALIARRRTTDPELRFLCAALAGAVLAVTVCSATFDSLSFPMCDNVYALVIGMVGASWRLAARGSAPPPTTLHRATVTGQLAGREPATTTRTVHSAGG